MTHPHPLSALHQQLRQATKPLHHDLDHHPLMAPLLKPDIRPAQYGDALAALHPVLAAAEAGILGFLATRPGLFDYAARIKLPALDSDLAALGRTPAPAAACLPPIDSLAALIGVLYTLEGSTQGGQYIARNLRQTAPSGLPLAFYTVYGELALQRWDEFLQFAARHCPHEAHDAAAATAVAMFTAIKHHLDACELAGQAGATPPAITAASAATGVARNLCQISL